MEQLMNKLQTLGVEWEQNCPLSRHSSFRIGGAADLAIFPHSSDALCQTLTLLRGQEIPVLVIGNGSNVVFSDAGYRGAVVFTGKCRKIKIQDDIIFVDAGASLSALASAARDESLSGLEFAFGIPGTLGGAIYMNAGAYGGSMSDICVGSHYYDLETSQRSSLIGNEQEFDYRKSIYQKHPERVVLGATLKLKKGNRNEITEAMRTYFEKRRATQPLDLPNAGSVFKRPEGHFAGKLIEDCGLKGLTVGGAQVSAKHAGFIVNIGGATCEDIKRLIEQIQTIVSYKTGVELECEIKFL
ncbi:MAG: UDP-N-acetylmuramate dehydrogenase [Ruminococcaceae bacterium]|nr:UDP-N-acetylmuramate dehydrogenase [Oscillospiraceae bacterium]